MRLHRLPSIIAPWPNLALAAAMAFCFWVVFKDGQDEAPVVIGAVVGLVPALIDALTRSSMNSALRSASNSAEVITAYRATSLAGNRHFLGVALLLVAGYFGRDYLPDADAVVMMVLGFAFVHLLSHGILGLWTAWPTTHE